LFGSLLWLFHVVVICFGFSGECVCLLALYLNVFASNKIMILWAF
jgi:hypothetical protein